jgi:hypothetical protein
MELYESNDIFFDRNSGVTPSSHPDMKMEVYGATHDDGDIFILHDRPFHQELSWVEYDKTDSRIDFIMDDGNIRNFGINVPSEFGEKLKKLDTVSVILTRDQIAVSGEDYPLIMHG